MINGIPEPEQLTMNKFVAVTLALLSMTLAVIAMALAFLLMLATPAHAHNLNIAGVKVTLGTKSTAVSVMVHLHQLDAKRPEADLVGRLKLRLDGKPFVPDSSQFSRDDANGIVMWQAQRKQTAARVGLDAPIFPEKTDQSTSLTVLKNRQVWGEAVVDASHPSATVGGSEATSASEVFWRFLRQGVLHIFGGPDHVLFLLSLLLLGGSWKHLLKIVTAFTLAHSITLSLAATGVFSLPPRIVEPIIALSIVAVALANLRKGLALAPNAQEKAEGEQTKQRDFRPWMAFGFGLIHGFGFAGALGEVGLPHQALGLALLAFNAGVEVGQATIVLLFAPTLAFVVALRPKVQLPIVRYGSVGVALVGAFWFVQRVLSA